MTVVAAKALARPANGGAAQRPAKDSNRSVWVDLKELNRRGPHMKKLMSVCRVKSLGVQPCVYIFYLAPALESMDNYVLMCPRRLSKKKNLPFGPSPVRAVPCCGRTQRRCMFRACWDPSTHLPLIQLCPFSGSQI